MTSSPYATIDFETRSTVDLKKAGVYRYAEHPSTSVICMSYRIGDGPVQRWKPWEFFPEYLTSLIEDGATVVAHNSGFERAIWRMLQEQGAGNPNLRIEQQGCTMARAQALALPAALSGVAEALGTSVQKDMEGQRLMMKMCRPRSIVSMAAPSALDTTERWTDPPQILWHEKPEDIDRLQAYCDQDVETECAVDKILPQLSEAERRVWELDQHINDRGVAIDVKTVSRALAVVEEARKRADKIMWRLTGGAVKKCTETAKIVAWLNGQGVPCTSIAKGEIEEIILCAQVQGIEVAEEVIRLRRAAAKSSTAKYTAMLNSVCSDGRCRGTLGYHVASTGRWGGRLIQPQNFPRVDPDRDLPGVLLTLDLLASPKSPIEIVDCMEVMGLAPLETLSKCLRAMIWAEAGKKLVGGDFANIEGRVNAWLAGEEWKVKAFRAFDEGRGPDLYKRSYAESFGVDVDEVTKWMRLIGKVQELQLGYQGSVGAFMSMAAIYGINLSEMAEAIAQAVSINDWAAVERQYDKAVKQGQGYGLDRDTWTGVKLVVNRWRDAHPNIVQAWWDLQDAAIQAVAEPGLKVPVYGGKVHYMSAKGFLWCKLPSGRMLAYCQPKLVWTVVQKAEPAYTDDEGVLHEAVEEKRKLAVHYMGVDSTTKKWKQKALYGGHQCENIVQAVARDLLVESMFRLEAAGYPLVLTVHDECISEVPAGFGGAEDYEKIMAVLPDWATGLPVAAAAWEDGRYVK